MSPGEHRNFHSERFRPHWYISEFHDSIFQSVFKALNRFRKAVGVGVDYIAALVMSMPFAAALTQKNITVGRGVTIYVDDRKINPGDANGNPVEPMLYNGTTYLPIRAVSAALNVPIAWDGTTSSAYLGEHKVDQNAVNRAKAYVSVIEQLQSKYGKRAVSGSIISGLVTAMLIDFDGDGNEELLCVCNTKEKNAKGTNKHSTYMVYHWDGSKANCIAQHEVISPFSQNDPDYFKRTINIGERDGKSTCFGKPMAPQSEKMMSVLSVWLKP